MSHEALFKVMESRMEEQRNSILMKARQEAERILRKAQEEASRIEQEHKAQLDSRIKEEREVELNRAELDAHKELIRARAELVEESFRQARTAVLSLRGKPDYEQICRRLLEEALSEGEPVVVEVTAEDRELYERLLGERNCEIRLSPGASIGVTVELNNGDRILNTLESRLQRLEIELVKGVSQILFQGESS